MLFSIAFAYRLFLWIFSTNQAFSMLPYRLSVALLGIATLRAIDDFVLTEVDTQGLMKKNPIGYAIYIMAYAIIVAAALSGA